MHSSGSMLLRIAVSKRKGDMAMKNICLSRIRTRAATKVSNLLALAVIVIAFFATPCISLAYEASSGSDNNSSSSNNVATGKQDRLGLLGANGCLNKQNISRQDIANCLGLPNFSNLTSICRNVVAGANQQDVGDCPGIPDLGNLASLCGNDVAGDDQQDGGDCLGIPDLGNLTSLCKFLGIGSNNPNNLAAGTKQKDIANCLGIPDLSNLTSLCTFLGRGNNNPNNLVAGTKRKDITNCLGIPDLSNLPSLSGLTDVGNNSGSIAARARASSKQSSPSTAKLAGIVQFATVEAGGRQTISQNFAAQQDGSTPKFRIVPAQVANIGKGDFIGAYFNGKLAFGVGLGAGRAELFDPVTSQPTVVQLS